jgi:hypothetical protein
VLVPLAGPNIIEAAGAIVSIVMLTAEDAGDVLPALAIAIAAVLL